MKKSRLKTKNRKRDYDQLGEDTLIPENAVKLLNQPVDLDLPGQAQFYCVPCARYFVGDEPLQQHYRSKNHKRQLGKIADQAQYDHKEALAAAGFGSYRPPATKLRKVDIDVRKEHFAMEEKGSSEP